MSIHQQVSEWNDEQQAEALEAILSDNLGPKALAAQNAHITSCAREYVIMDRNAKRVLLFWRPAGVRYGETWHVSGTTVNADKLKKIKGLTPFEFVREKYGLKDIHLTDPNPVDFVIVPQGSQPWECAFGEIWTQIYSLHYIRGYTPENAGWFSLDDLPNQTLEYHRYVLLPRIRKHLYDPGSEEEY